MLLPNRWQAASSVGEEKQGGGNMGTGKDTCKGQASLLNSPTSKVQCARYSK